MLHRKTEKHQDSVWSRQVENPKKECVRNAPARWPGATAAGPAPKSHFCVCVRLMRDPNRRVINLVYKELYKYHPLLPACLRTFSLRRSMIN